MFLKPTLVTWPGWEEEEKGLLDLVDLISFHSFKNVWVFSHVLKEKGNYRFHTTKQHCFGLTLSSFGNFCFCKLFFDF